MKKRIRYLTILLLMLVSVGSWGQVDSGFDPSMPPEPGSPIQKYRLELIVEPMNAGSVSGAGWYAESTNVSVLAHPNSGYTFDRWSNEQGLTVSTDACFSFTKKAEIETLTAHFTFTPNTPEEPDVPENYYRLNLTASDGGSVSGGGRYTAGTTVQIWAYPNSGYEFIGWYTATGALVSLEQTFSYTMLEGEQTLNARFQFNPLKPGEPEATPEKYAVTVTASDGGTTNISIVCETVGTKIWLQANTNPGYRFDGWYLGDQFYTKELGFYYTVMEGGASFFARFTFDPLMPEDPYTADNKKFSLYLMNHVSKPGTEIEFPIYFSALEDLGDISFQINFAPEIKPYMDKLKYSEKVSDYEISYQAIDECTYSISFRNGILPPCDITLVTFTIPISEDIVTAKGYQVKINQTSISQFDENIFCASTRNGRISVYKEGDANGDDTIDVADIATVISFMAGDYTEDYVRIMCDANNDGTVDVADIATVIDIMATNARMAPLE